MVKPQNKNDNQKNEYDFLVYEYHTWGSFGQHQKTILVVVDIDKKTQKPIWEVIDGIKWIKNDSRKNYHREAYSRKEVIINILEGKILKEIKEYQSSSKKKISVKYYIISDDIQEIKSEERVRINGKYYDIIELNGKKIMVNKDEIIVQ